MPESVFQLRAFLEDDGKRKPLYVEVLAPARAQTEQDYFCLVRAPLLLGQDKKIYGIDPDQARSLAVDFIRSLLEDKKAVDGDGMPVKL
ncbi:MAG: hypothetical protein ABJA75_12150 [Bradyrhizobium sp.]